ncbi:hypothetical protein C1T17_05760 [Sphingobium sp. SCG-1]|uniref:hypothetical protein n=1 Tax=Sphingobium sp. SCG-1 TaxID=2072936 RepID=UPI000CD67F1E|nr:hypothetical protein [Sphingobium sp. SCG-1]AUW57683.1 hypothetical protein C1T17_05760 [Sphingobium sp. SCG-1]
MSRKPKADVAFLFLGEMLLVPHLWPIVDALARERPKLIIDLWISTSVHEDLLSRWMDPDVHGNVRLRHAPGYSLQPVPHAGDNPELPAKMPMLARLAPRLARMPVVVCAEQTSLWLPRLLPMRSRFIFTVHGAGPLNYNKDGRLRYASRLFVPSDYLTKDHVRHGIAQENIVVTGYVKASFAPSLTSDMIFPEARPVVLYTPHWQSYRSSWWDWGRQIVEMLAEQSRFNVIIAPHQRLFEQDRKARAFLDGFSSQRHMHEDSGSFAMVDGSYTRMADLYLGDSSSQIIEFLANPRPCVIADSPSMTWPSGDYQKCGDVVRTAEDIWPALMAASERHSAYRDFQHSLALEALGNADEEAALRSARAILDLLDS